MAVQTLLTTERLILNALSTNDNHFIFELVNSEGWIQFIGNRYVNSAEEAKPYIQKIIANPNVSYWVVQLKENQENIGVVSLIKRDYLEHHDIGFAFLPRFANKGYAHEAANVVLTDVIDRYQLSHVFATTIPQNLSSIKLLHKLGLRFEKDITVEGETLHLYGIAADHVQINNITSSFFSVFTNTNGQVPKWDLLRQICIPEILIINNTTPQPSIFNLTSFIGPRQKILSDGTLSEFVEYEVLEQTTLFNGIAQRYAQYEKKGILEGKPFHQKGHKFLQFVKTGESWKISAAIWEDEPD
jgi:RimJ/RimL family protein N-acetyltransferase